MIPIQDIEKAKKVILEIIQYDAKKYYKPGWLSKEKTKERTDALTTALNIISEYEKQEQELGRLRKALEKIVNIIGGPKADENEFVRLVESLKIAQTALEGRK